MFGSLWLAVLGPVAFMPIVYVLGRSMGKKTWMVAIIPLLYSTLYLGSMIGGIASWFGFGRNPRRVGRCSEPAR